MSNPIGSNPYYNAGVDRQDHAQILADLDGLRTEGIIVKTTGAVVPMGTVMGRITSGGKYIAYLTGASDGSEVAVGVLLDEVDTAGGDVACRLAVGGTFYSAKVVGMDAGAIADLNSKVVTNAQGEVLLRIP